MKYTNEDLQKYAAFIRREIADLSRRVEQENQEFLKPGQHFLDRIAFAGAAADRANKLELTAEEVAQLGKLGNTINAELRRCRIAIAQFATKAVAYKSRSAARKMWIAVAKVAQLEGDPKMARDAHEVLWALTAGWTLGGTDEEIRIWENLEHIR